MLGNTRFMGIHVEGGLVISESNAYDVTSGFSISLYIFILRHCESADSSEGNTVTTIA